MHKMLSMYALVLFAWFLLANIMLSMWQEGRLIQETQMLKRQKQSTWFADLEDSAGISFASLPLDTLGLSRLRRRGGEKLPDVEGRDTKNDALLQPAPSGVHHNWSESWFQMHCLTPVLYQSYPSCYQEFFPASRPALSLSCQSQFR